MNENAKCPKCGAPLPADSPEGLCPRCLVALNLATQTEISGETGPHGTKIVKPPLPVPDVAKLFPQLEILECLGRGGMGAVYKARQPRLDRIVALKILSPEKQNEPKFAERFEREARALAKLHHPNIVTVYDFGEVQGNFYLLMEFVDGLTLRQLIHSKKLSAPEALAIVPKICEALQYAHEQGIDHRDIKPENILLGKSGRVKIADFGIAKIIGDGERANLTAEQVIGTPHYMSPEQIEKPEKVDHRADIYSLGVVFYEMLTGELPLGKFSPPSKKVHIDVRLDEVVLRSLEKEPERRYQHASEVKTRVETIASTSSVVVGKNFLRTPFAISNATPFSKFIFWAAIPIFGCYFFLLLNDHFNGTNEKLWHYFSYFFLAFAAICGVDTLFRIRNGIKAKTLKSRHELRFMYLTMAFSGMLAVAIVFFFVFLPGYRKHLPSRTNPAFYIGQTWFPQGDSIEITSVERNENQMTVKGHYNLVSHDNASLALYITVTNKILVPVGPNERIQISKGRGDFELIDPHLVPGMPHVSMYGAFGRSFASLYFGTRNEVSDEYGDQFAPFASVYFGTKEEAAEESTAQIGNSGTKSSIPSDGLIALWQADNNGKDSIGGHDGSLQNVNFTDGVIGHAFAFDPNNFPRGTYTGVKIPDDPAFALTNSLSIEGWVRVRDQSYIIFWRGDHRPGLDPYFIGMDANNRIKFAICGEDGNYAVVDAEVQFNRWYHIATTFKDGDMKFYLNGALAAETNTPIRPFADLIPSEHPGIGIGNLNDGGNNFPFTGDIDELAVYNRALSAEEVRSIYSNEEPKRANDVTLTASGDVSITTRDQTGQSSTIKAQQLTYDSQNQTLTASGNPNNTWELFVQDDPASTNAALSSIKEWLALMDAGNYAKSWNQAADSFHDAISQQAWVATSEKVRAPLGKLISRKVKTTEESTTLSGFPNGDYVVATFDTDFAQFSPAKETVSASLDKNGQWKVIGYLIQPADADGRKIFDQDKSVVSAAESWLQTIDNGNYAQSWQMASEYFQGAISQDKWASALESVRQPLGQMISRKLQSEQRMTQLPGVPDGQYVLMQFDASFANKKFAVETVTFMLERDGQWKAVGYYIK